MKKDFRQILTREKLKITPARLAILGLFSEDCGPLSAEDIVKKIKNKDINQVTVYRTLAALEEKGILKKVDLRKGSVHYELAEHHHHHIVCKECGKIEEFDGCELDGMSKKILASSSKFKDITEHSFEFFGICKACARV